MAGETECRPVNDVGEPCAGEPHARIEVAAGGARDQSASPRGHECLSPTLLHHRMRESWKQRGRWYLHKWPSRRAMTSIKAKIRDRTDRRFARLPLEYAVENVNHVVRGWGNYFRYGNSADKFGEIDGYVRERLAILASAKHGLQGRNWVSRFNYEWTTQLGVYRLSGTVRPTLAFASR